MPGGIIATVQREGDARTRGSKIADAHPDLWDRSAGRRFGLRRDPGTATEARDAPPDKSNVSSQTATLIDVDGEMMRLRVIVDSAESERAWMARTQAPVAASAQTIDRPQLLVVVDRNPDVEQIRLVLARPDGAWSSLGGTKVSTGQAGARLLPDAHRRVLAHGSDTRLAGRGTFNPQHIRGLGLKGIQRAACASRRR